MKETERLREEVAALKKEVAELKKEKAERNKTVKIQRLTKEQLIAKIKELHAYLAKESDEARDKAGQYNRYEDYYEGAHRAYEIAVYTIRDILGTELPEHW